MTAAYIAPLLMSKGDAGFLTAALIVLAFVIHLANARRGSGGRDE